EADGDCVAYRWYADKRSVRYDTSREPIPCKSHPDGNAFRLYTSLRCFIRAMLKNFVLGTTKLAKKESRYKKKTMILLTRFPLFCTVLSTGGCGKYRLPGFSERVHVGLSTTRHHKVIHKNEWGGRCPADRFLPKSAAGFISNARKIVLLTPWRRPAKFSFWIPR